MDPFEVKDPSKERVVLVDLMNMFVRSFSVISLSNNNKQHVGGYYGTLQSLISVMQKFNPDHCYIAWEGEHSSQRRKEILTEYKGGRKKTGFNPYFQTTDEDERESFSRQLNVLYSIFDNLSVYQGKVDYLEADDLIAYLCNHVLKDGFEKIIISCDRDFFQLLDEHIVLYRPNVYKVEGTNKRQNGELVIQKKIDDQKYCIEVYRKDKKGDFYLFETIPLMPQNHVIIKCFGEPADNISGIKGIKEKTLFRDFPFLATKKEGNTHYTIDDIIEYSQKQVSCNNKKYQKYIEPENKEILLRNQRLIQLLTPEFDITSVETIKNTLRYSTVLKPSLVRLSMMKEGISQYRINSWIDTFLTLKREKMHYE